MSAQDSGVIGIGEVARWSGAEPANWVTPAPGVDHDVVVVGGGQNGVAIAHGLRRRGIGNVKVIDQAPHGTATGIWTTTARMNLLRTPKNLPGPTYGNSLLGFQSWFERRYGAAAFDALTRIPRLTWAEYLDWYRDVSGIEVEHDQQLVRVDPAGANLRLWLESAGRPHQVVARKLVLATGMQGSGGVNIPSALRELPRSVFAHTSQDIDRAAFAGKIIAVVGSGPSAFDAAAAALEAGAQRVHLISRRAAIGCVPKDAKGGGPGGLYPGVEDNFFTLPDQDRWNYQWLRRQAGASVPVESAERVMKFSNFHVHLSSAVTQAVHHGNRVQATVNGEQAEFDFIIAATGYWVDLSAQPELRDVAGHVELWGDRFQPPWGPADDALARYPYLGPGFELREKAAGAAPWAGNIHVFTIAANLSFGKIVSDIPSAHDLPALVGRISHDLFHADYERQRDRICRAPALDTSHTLYAGAIRTSISASSNAST